MASVPVAPMNDAFNEVYAPPYKTYCIVSGHLVIKVSSSVNWMFPPLAVILMTNLNSNGFSPSKTGIVNRLWLITPGVSGSQSER